MALKKTQMDELLSNRETTGDIGQPTLSDDPAFIGPLGEYAQIAASLTEVDPFAALATALVAVATMMGPRPHVQTGHTMHPPVLFALLVAETPKANRGMSWRLARDLIDAASPGQTWGQVAQGLSSEAGLIGALGLRRRVSSARGADRPEFRSVLVHEPAFAHVLTVSRRASSPLPWLLRNAWDGLPLDPIRNPSIRHHVGIVAHVTLEQLRSQVSLTDTSATFLGRFLFVRVRRPAPVLDEGSVPAAVTARLGELLGPRLARARAAGNISRGNDMLSYWFTKYGEISEDDPGGLLGIAVARAAWFVTRLSLVYAVTDGETEIRQRHVDAALSLWRYCRASAAWALGGRASDSLEERLLELISRAGPTGLSLSQQSASLGHNVPAARLAAARRFLEGRGMVETVPVATGRPGRPARISRLRQDG